LAFKVAARTVLELGAELISSDAVAIYELVKNAIDAGSKDGVTIEFCVTLRYSDYVDALERIDSSLANDAYKGGPDEANILGELKKSIKASILPDAPRNARLGLASAIARSASVTDLREDLVAAYVEYNWIEFRDTGVGMSKKDILESYMVIGTASRRKDLEARLKRGQDAVYLGEKGVGRLSAMRLGSHLQVITASEHDERLNLLDVDWKDFEDLEKMIEDVDIKPRLGGRRPAAWTGTTIRISGLNATWSANRIRDIATFELARLSDPFSKKKRRYRIVVQFNESRVSIPRLESELLNLAHAQASGSYEFDAEGNPQLVMDVSCGDLGKGNPPDSRHIMLQRVDLRSITKDAATEVPASALKTVGPFTFELYWFNRQLLRKQLSPADYKRLGPLQKQWSGVMLFRNGYRVFPYGDDTDDWLGLDRRALASGGYKLNKSQFIGRVSITRTGNPELIDQTSREGLKDCDEKTVFVELLRFVIQDRMRKFLDDVEKRHAPKDVDLDAADRRVEDLQTRTKSAINGLVKRHADDAPQLRELLAFFEEMHAYFAAARKRASEVEDERERMVQLAGVGLMLEMIAHELARSTETALGLLTEADPDDLPEDVAALFATLRDEMKTMNRRLRVLDPLSVSGRQRKENFDLAQLVNEIFAGHKAQFTRHNVKPSLRVLGGQKSVMIYGVRGMYVQIVENLVQNSIYWMDLRSEDDETYQPRINIVLSDGDRLMDYTDNGPGIHPSLREEVFTAFFSTKGKSRRQGLGLYIAQDCAKSNGTRLRLSEEQRVQAGRLNTFLLERIEEAA
jgi:signal transduction histidine kinase